MRYDIIGCIGLVFLTLVLNLLLYHGLYEYFSCNLLVIIDRHHSGLNSTTLPTQIRTPRLSTTQPRRFCSDYVIFSNGFQDGRGIGNQIFNFAVGVYVSELTGRRLAINDSGKSKTYLEEVFRLDMERFTHVCPIFNFGDDLNLAYNARVENLFRQNNNEDTDNKTINLSGFFQSWKYTRTEKSLRKQLKFRNEIRFFVTNFFESSVPPGWVNGLFTRVGIHIRRGDVLNENKINFGYTTPSVSYFRKAMQYMTDTYKKVQFLVASNDYEWAKANISPQLIERSNNLTLVNVTVLKDNSGGQDLAILARCDHNIMSTGTFGWWGAWLAKGTTIYYSNWPRNGSGLNEMFKKYDFFLPSWIGMDD